MASEDNSLFKPKDEDKELVKGAKES